MASLRASAAALERWRTMWECLSAPTLVGSEALDLTRRMYFGYLVPSMYVFPLERWFDVYPRDQLHVLDFDRFTSNTTRNEYLSDFVTNALGLPDWAPASSRKVGGLGAFMSAPCFPDGKSYPKAELRGGGDAPGVVSAVQSRLRPLSRLLVELTGAELEWAQAA